MANKAKTLLLEKIEEFGGYDIAARVLGCTRENLYNLTSPKSKKRPGLDMAFAIETYLGVPMTAWANKLEKRTRKPKAA